MTTVVRGTLCLLLALTLGCGGSGGEETETPADGDAKQPTARKQPADPKPDAEPDRAPDAQPDPAPEPDQKPEPEPTASPQEQVDQLIGQLMRGGDPSAIAKQLAPHAELACAALIDRTKRPPRRDQMMAMKALVALGPKGDGALVQLLCESPSRIIVREAIKALPAGQGAIPAAGLKKLTEAMKHPRDVQLRRMATDATIARAGDAAPAMLAEVLGTPRIGGEVIDIIGSKGKAGLPLLGRVAEVLGPKGAPHVWNILARTGYDDPAARPALSVCARCDDPDIVKQARSALAKLPAADADPAARVGEVNPDDAGPALDALIASGKVPDELLPRLIKLLRNAKVGGRAAKALALMGPRAEPAIAELVRARHFEYMHEEALEALTAIGEPAVEPMLAVGMGGDGSMKQPRLIKLWAFYADHGEVAAKLIAEGIEKVDLNKRRKLAARLAVGAKERAAAVVDVLVKGLRDPTPGPDYAEAIFALGPKGEAAIADLLAQKGIQGIALVRLIDSPATSPKALQRAVVCTVTSAGPRSKAHMQAGVTRTSWPRAQAEALIPLLMHKDLRVRDVAERLCVLWTKKTTDKELQKLLSDELGKARGGQ